MKENDVAFFVEQYGLTKEIVEASIADGTLSQRIKDATKDRVEYTKSDFDTFKKNYSAEVTSSYFNDLIEKAKKGDVPTDLYNPIKGAALQQFEREVAKKYGVDSFDDANDLVEKIVKSSANGKSNEDLERQISELKTRNTELATEKEDALKTAQNDFANKMIARDLNDLLSVVPFDMSDVKAEEKKSKLERTQTLLKSVFSQDHSLAYDENGKLVVKRGDEVMKNQNTYDPVDPKDVMINLAKEYGLKLTSPDTGGQGGQSSGSSSGQYESVEAFEKDMVSKGISPSDPAYIKAYSESGLRNNK